MTRYLIIGSGAAGFAAAQTIRSKDHSGEIILICDDPFGYYSRPGLAYYLTGELPENMLFPVRNDEWRHMRIKYISGRGTQIDAPNHRLKLESGQLISYDRLLITTGAEASPLDVPGAQLAGVVKLDNLSDARQIAGLARKAKTAVVVGGGITALELVEGLVARKVKVNYLMRGDHYWNAVLDESEAMIVESRLISHGVFVHYRTELEAILSDPKKKQVAAVRTTQGEIIPCDLVAFAIGIRPRIGLALTSNIQVDRGILVDETMRTSADDVFAAGDVAQVYDPLTGKAVLDSLWHPARQQGHIAGRNMTGEQTSYTKGMPFNVTRLAGLTTTIIGMVGRRAEKGVDADLAGIARGDSETWRALPECIAAQKGFDVNHLRLMIGEKHLVGAVVMGDQTLSQPLQHLATAKADLTPIRERLLMPGADLAEIILDYYAAWRKNDDPLQ